MNPVPGYPPTRQELLEVPQSQLAGAYIVLWHTRLEAREEVEKLKTELEQVTNGPNGLSSYKNRCSMYLEIIKGYEVILAKTTKKKKKKK